MALTKQAARRARLRHAANSTRHRNRFFALRCRRARSRKRLSRKSSSRRDSARRTCNRRRSRSRRSRATCSKRAARRARSISTRSCRTPSSRRSAPAGARRPRRSFAASASATTRCRSSPACRSTSTTSITAARKAPSWTCSTSSASKCCAARKARCSARTRSAAPCASSRASREGDGTGFLDVGVGSRDRLNLRGSYDFALVEEKVFARVSASSKTQDGYFDILDYECVNGAGSLGLGGPGIAAGTNASRQPRRHADSDESGAGFRTPSNTHPAIGGVALGSVLGPTDDRGCVVDHFGSENVQSGRVARAVPGVRHRRGQRHRRPHATSTSRARPTSTPCSCARRTACRPASRRGINSWNNNVAVPVFGAGGQFDGRFQTPDEYTGYHRFGYDPLTAAHHAERQRAHAQGPAGRPSTGTSPTTCTSSRRRRIASSTTRSAAIPTARRCPQLFTWDTSKHEQFTQEFQFERPRGSERRHRRGRRASSTTTRSTRTRATTTLRLHVELLRSQGRAGPHELRGVRALQLGHHREAQHVGRLALHGRREGRDDLRVTGNTAPPGVGAPQFVLIRQRRGRRGIARSGRRRSASTTSSPTRSWATRQLSTGFRGGGFGPRPANALQVAAFQPEFIDSFEVGVKSDWLDGRLRFNGDVYYMENTDKQQATQTARRARRRA